MWDYSAEVRRHVFEPENAGALADADAIGEAGAMACGDALKLMLKFDAETGVVTQARFQSYGCGATIAAASAVTELVIGLNVEAALALTDRDIHEALGGLPVEKMHGAVMGFEALRAALAAFREGARAPAAPVCACAGASAAMLERTIRAHALTSLEAVAFHTRAGGTCASCRQDLEATLQDVNAAMAAEGLLPAAQAFRQRPAAPRLALAPAAAPIAREEIRIEPPKTAASKAQAATSGMTNLQRMRCVESALEELRPMLKRDGGDCELVDVDGDKVLVRLKGACVGCKLASATISGVQQKLIEKLGAPLRVVPVT